MNQVKPYLFWIAAGLALVILLIVVLTQSPTDEQGRTAPAVKQALDNEVRELNRLHGLARAGDPVGEWDVENQERREELLKRFLVTDRWQPVFTPHVAKYERQAKEIADYLVERSRVLRQPLAPSTDLFAWYQVYRQRSDALIQGLQEQQALQLPAAAGPRMGGASGAEAEEGVSRQARDAAGFFTKGSDNPPASEHERLTIRLRILEQVFQTILAAPNANRENPVLGEGRPPGPPRPAAITAVTWLEPVPPGADGMAMHGLTLSLIGPVSSLLAAEAALERNADDRRPLLVVTGGGLAAKTSYPVGERKDAPTEHVTMKLDLAVLDFSAKAAK